MAGLREDWEPMLEVIDLYKTYEKQPLLQGISFSIAAGETLCLLGASGSGKSTILRIIAGLEQPKSGVVHWAGQDLTGMPAHRRNFGLMFQDYALFPHMTVFENVAFGLRMQGGADWQTSLIRTAQQWPEKAIKERVISSLALVRMAGFEHRRVTELSGGEQQRVALARALAPRPRLLMLDEPLGALDRALRENLLEELRGILHQTGIPAIYVTHDQAEAFTIADKIILLRDGQIAQGGTPPEVFARPVSGWVASFLGLGNVLEGVISASGVDTPVGRIRLKCPGPLGAPVTLLLRPRAEVVAENETLAGKVADVVFRGEQFRVELENGLYFYVEHPVKPGELVKLNVLQVECL
jgi:spermidine/putrescine transport system ATP-binding protein